jgi:hypothetical protein
MEKSAKDGNTHAIFTAVPLLFLAWIMVLSLLEIEREGRFSNRQLPPVQRMLSEHFS